MYWRDNDNHEYPCACKYAFKAALKMIVSIRDWHNYYYLNALEELESCNYNF